MSTRSFISLGLAVALLATAPALAGCDTVAALSGSGGGVSSSAVLGKTTVDDKGLYGAEAAYNALASDYLTLVRYGFLTGSMKAQAKAAVQKAYAGLKVARGLYKAGNSNDLSAQVAVVTSLIADARKLVPAHK